MNLEAINVLDLLGNLTAVLFTLLVLSYAFGDNPIFRLAIHVFIGVTAGYAGGVVWHAVVQPQLVAPLVSLNFASPGFALRFLLAGLLLTKLSPRTAVLGNPASAFLVGIGAATAIGGAIQGTIIPLAGGSSGLVPVGTVQQILGEGTSGLLLGAAQFLVVSLMLAGTIATLVYFHFGASGASNQTPQRNAIISVIALVGKAFIAITFGALFAGVFNAALSALVNRFFFLWIEISGFLFG